MKRILEASIENSFVAHATALGFLALKMEVKGSRNWPDRQILMGGGHTFFIEFKRPGETPNAGQLYRHKKLRERGYKVYVCDNLQDAKSALAWEMSLDG